MPKKITIRYSSEERAHSSSPLPSRLTAVLGAFTTLGAALASLLAHEAAAQHCQARGEAATVLLLPRRRRLLVLHLLLALRRTVVHLLARWGAAVLLVVATLRGAVAGWVSV